jgi:hypothetical protein
MVAMNKIVSGIAHGFVHFTNKSLIKNLIVITLCIMFFFVQVFFPYQHYASAQKGTSEFQVGIHYVYEQDELDQIYGQVGRIHDLGFKVIRITLECNPIDTSNIQNRKNDAFFSATDSYGLAVALVVKNLDETAKVDYYLDRWGSHLEYIQIFNEPELSSTWSLGAMFTDDEIKSKFDIMYNVVASHHLEVKYYTNFGIGYILRSNVPIELAPKLDFVGLDIFMDAFLVLSPHFIQNLQKTTDRDVVITEFGMSTTNHQAQTDFIIKGLNLFKNMGLPGCWLVYWNSAYDSYGIRDTETETAVGEWIAANAN